MQPFIPRFKRKRNRIPLNFLSSQKGPKKRYKFAKEDVTVSLPNPVISNVCSVVSPGPIDPPPDDYAEYHEEDDATLTPTVSAHTRRKEKLAEKWNAIRTSAYKKMIQTYALPLSKKCAMCNNNEANVRCQQCGPLFMCQSCCFDIHGKLHYHHFPELWQVCVECIKLCSYISMHIHRMNVLCHLNYHLSLLRFLTMSVIPPFSAQSHVFILKVHTLYVCMHACNLMHIGAPCSLNIQFCKCQPDALRLIELGYWPATPSHPGLAFTQSFMDWMEALLLECQVAVQDFTSAIEMLVKEKFAKVSTYNAFYLCRNFQNSRLIALLSNKFCIHMYFVTSFHRCHAVFILF